MQDSALLMALCVPAVRLRTAGKTVEIIALVLANQAPGAAVDGGTDVGPGPDPGTSPVAGATATGSPHPAAGSGAMNGGASGQQWDGGTVVICPATLLQQWRAELANHAHGSLRVEVYDGLAALRPPPSDRKKPVRRGCRMCG
jgi:hypothetical protein